MNIFEERNHLAEEIYDFMKTKGSFVDGEITKNTIKNVINEKIIGDLRSPNIQSLKQSNSNDILSAIKNEIYTKSRVEESWKIDDYSGELKDKIDEVLNDF
ncbi:hypothetical protein KMW28_12675 [Flammeovirga yaeyamensis]|uniref:Uncharacterized protein n=1 Tax=Flammeovirga yaeyamensis TaxID=367791 RepID=A0AAX1MZ44_9BACT|nr:hypothetical protein [Flammeovirga yaeyamensis]MBB3695977.1 hypothetical protein [Flammeovirga yaeyamensis]NMF34663.1 hypothetical protein [Flammeovirga yaeyamensis]QWG00507.1 hypothetical protein KMW28_12675 [Flammeovirga yaeyamensis]